MREQTIGKAVFVASAVLSIGYLYMISSPTLWWWGITTVTTAIVLGGLGMLAWIGYSLARYPSYTEDEVSR